MNQTLKIFTKTWENYKFRAINDAFVSFKANQFW
jgi:hypothetical protein